MPQTSFDASHFQRRGYAVVDDFLSASACTDYLAQIGRYRQQHSLPLIERRVRGRSTRYCVIDGYQIQQHLPAVWQLYQQFQATVNGLSGQSLVPLPNQRVGVNINIVPAGGEYRWHYDRNALTALIYLNQPQGGETEFYPRYRLPLQLHNPGLWQRWADRLLAWGLVRRVFGRKVLVAPQAGRLVAMQANRCLHSVRPVQGATDRINIILAYDRPRAAFAGEARLDEYLYSQAQVSASDPNYRE